MKCKEARNKIKRLERQNFLLQTRINNSVKHVPEGRRYDFNLLEIIVQPHKDIKLPYNDQVRIRLRILGDGTVNIPDRLCQKTITKTSIEFAREHDKRFINRIGEIMATELLQLGENTNGM